jgi:anaerobic ribonucleoside-triphosphate reductase
MSEVCKCEVYSRVVGYLSPVSEWNKGKKEEFRDRKEYRAENINKN